ncbi:hypothetical protein [Mycobacterium sp. 852002-51057_SCH5723018]|uniref:hypothetical protein n=1 Tax=Mycobacterium sp. 852002-51057_SCH5723018 TaxID=1834094 RepID=UPI0007FFAC75|nr:hypothetical protein [Mycobacterium sp. 852002-51057_SCH5723018]OBG20773.1 hypothetical protein A5764_15005 [Mycobacterium sp. 852002-51057_SCH5723018]
MVGEQQDPDSERVRLEYARIALGMLNSHVIEGGPKSTAIDQWKGLIYEEADKVGDDKAVAVASTKVATGMTYVAWELLAMRESETGRKVTETLEHLGRVFNPPGK